MKKIFYFLSALAFTAVLLTSCGKTPEHTHAFEKVNEVASTCKVKGTKEHYKCTGCDKIFDMEKKETTLDKLELPLGAHVAAQEWQHDDSAHWKLCSVCQEKINSSIGYHSWDEGKKTKDETCSTDGEMTYTCTVCQTTKKSTIAGGHIWDAGTVTKDPTCTTAGEMTYRCTRQGCNETKVEPIKATGHTPTGGWKYDDTNHWNECANCTDHLNEAPHKAATAWESDDTDHWHKCEADCGYEFAKEAHNVTSWTTIKPASKTEEGLEKGTCTECEREIERAIPKVKPSYAEMIAAIDALSGHAKAMERLAVDAVKADYDLFTATEVLNITNRQKLLDLVAEHKDATKVVINPSEHEAEASAGYAVTVESDADFTSVYKLANTTATDYSKIKIDLKEADLDDVSTFSIFVKGYTGGSLIVLTDYAKATELSGVSFVLQDSRLLQSDRNNDAWGQSIGEASGWNQYCLDITKNKAFIDNIVGLEYVGFKFLTGTSAEIQVSPLLALKNSPMINETDKQVRQLTNSWGNGEAANVFVKSNLGQLDKFLISEKGVHYCYMNKTSGELTGKGITLVTNPLESETTNATSLKQYFYVKGEVSFCFKVGSLAATSSMTFTQGWHCIDFDSTMLGAINVSTAVNIQLTTLVMQAGASITLVGLIGH